MGCSSSPELAYNVGARCGDRLHHFDRIKALAKQYPKEFLRGLYDKGGIICTKVWQPSALGIYLVQKDRRLLELASELLKSFEIKTRIYTIENDCSSLYMCKSQAIKFRDVIGFTVRDKQKRLENAKIQRPRTLDEDTVHDLQDLVDQKASIGEIAGIFDVSVSTMYRWLKKVGCGQTV